MLMGDFNFGDRRIECKHLPDEFIDCWKVFAKATGKDERLQGLTCGGNRLDKMLVRSDKWKVEHFEKLGKRNMPSDHLGIVTKFVDKCS